MIHGYITDLLSLVRYKSSFNASHKTSSTFHIQKNTEHMRFKARLQPLTVPQNQQQQKNIESHEIKVKNHIKRKLYIVEFFPQAIVRDSFFFFT